MTVSSSGACSLIQCHQPAKQPAQNDFSRNDPQSPSSIYIEYNSIMEKRIHKLFLICTVPNMMLYVFHKYSHMVLTKIDIENINAEIANKGERCGARLLLERLILYEDWFNVLMQVLRDPRIKLNHVADYMEQKTYSTKEWYKKENIKTEKIYAREQQNITNSANMVCNMVQEQLLASLSVTEKDGQPPKQTNYCGKTELISAALSGNADLLVSCIETSDINETDSKGRTALMYAASKGHSESVELLIAYKCDVDRQNYNGYTALMIAVCKGHIECVKILANSADINIANGRSYTPLMAAASNGSIACMKLLLEKNCDINKHDNRNLTALMCATCRGHTVCVQLLIDRNCDVNISTLEGQTALIFAAIYGKLDCVRSLLQAKCDVNICNSNKQTALIFAAENGHNDIIEELLNAGADIDKQDENGDSAIMYAILQKHIECVRLLVRRHASLTLLNSRGDNPLKAARKKKISLDNTR